jgi:GntR family transcriptional regulator
MMPMNKNDSNPAFSNLAHLIERESPVPLYYQISEAISEIIRKARLEATSKIPPEDQLAQEFGVSKMTMRQALGKLVSDGVLVRRKGSGTFISEKKIEREATRLVSFYEDLKKKGLKPSSLVIEKRVIKAETNLMEKLRLDEGEPVIKIVRVRMANEIPLTVNYGYIPEKYCSDLLEEDLSQVSLSATVEEKYQLRTEYAVQSLQAVKATAYEASLLHIVEGDPILSMERTMFDSNQWPLGYFVNLFRGDKYAFSSILYR